MLCMLRTIIRIWVSGHSEIRPPRVVDDMQMQDSRIQIYGSWHCWPLTFCVTSLHAQCSEWLVQTEPADLTARLTFCGPRMEGALHAAGKPGRASSPAWSASCMQLLGQCAGRLQARMQLPRKLPSPSLRQLWQQWQQGVVTVPGFQV